MERSPLNKLAAELRIKIYEFALVRDEGLQLSTAALVPRIRHPEDTLNLAALTETCKQIRQEAMPVLLGNNITLHSDASRGTYYYTNGPQGSEIQMCFYKFEQWLHVLGPYVSSLRRLHLDLGIWQSGTHDSSKDQLATCICWTAREFQRTCVAYGLRVPMVIRLQPPESGTDVLAAEIMGPIPMCLDGCDALESQIRFNQRVDEMTAALRAKVESVDPPKFTKLCLSLERTRSLGVHTLVTLAEDVTWDFARCKQHSGRI